MLSRFRQDLRFALRAYARSPLFFLAACVTLGTGMAATLTIFSVVSGVLLRPLPYAAPSGLVHVGGSGLSLSFPDIVDARERTHAFEQVAAWQTWRFVVEDESGAPAYRWGASVSANFFDVLGIRPRAGRFFGSADDAPGHAPMVVVSESYWRDTLGGADDAVGRTIAIDSTTYTIVGVVPAGFVDPLYRWLIRSETPVLWRVSPPVFERGLNDRGWIGFWSVARLRDGVTIADAQAEVAAVAAQQYADAEEPPRARVVGLRDALVERVRPTLVALLAAALAVLLIACVNVANLLLSRASVRRREIAVRSSLGANRTRLVGQLLTESLVLSLASVALGGVLALAGTRALVHFAGAQLPRAAEIGMDWRVGVFALTVSVATALIFGLAPAFQFTGGRFEAALREGGRGKSAGRGPQRFRHSLIALEMALAVVLLASAGLLLRTVWNLQAIGPGFDAAAVMTARVSFIAQRFGTPELQNAALARMLREILDVGGVESAGAISDLPMSGAQNSTLVQWRERPNENTRALIRAVSGDYFDTMRVPRVRGRLFSPSDDGGPPVAILNEALAAQLLPGIDPLGRTVILWNQPLEVIGVVANVKEFTLTRGTDPALYLPYVQARPAWLREAMSVVVRSENSPRSEPAIRNAVHAAGATLTTAGVRPVANLIARDVATPRLRALLLGLFAAMALVLAAIGIAAVLAFTISQRIPEIGIRMALGADRRAILTLVLGGSARIAFAGVVFGIPGAFMAGRLLARFLYGVGPQDATIPLGAALVLFGVGLVASWVPARRAVAVDPASTLRSE